MDSTNISSRISHLNPSWNGDNSEETYYVNVKIQKYNIIYF